MDAAMPESSPNHEAYHNVDLFLREALQNPRHRLTVLRMELDIQRFMQNAGQNQFEFQQFPTSYLRLAAHRVAQHYGLQSMVLDIDGCGGKIVVRKTPESQFPSVFLSQIPAKVLENDKAEHVKIAIRPRPQKSSPNDLGAVGINKGSIRSVEERKEDYDKARARIFSSSSVGDIEKLSFQPANEGESYFSSGDENESRNTAGDQEQSVSSKDGSSRIAIFRDREKERWDPDYDRSYYRYSKGLVRSQSFSVEPLNVQNFHPIFMYDSELPQVGHVPRTQTATNFMASNPIRSHFGLVNLNGTACDSFYMQWPSSSTMYAHSHEHFRQSVFQVVSSLLSVPIDPSGMEAAVTFGICCFDGAVNLF